MENTIVNKVSASKLVTIDLEDFYDRTEKVVYDIADQLFQGLILREKDFRAHIKNHNWNQYRGKNVAITCTAEAIVPTWAYMLVTVNLRPVAKEIVFGTLEELDKELLTRQLKKINGEDYQDSKVVIKGCGDLNIGPFAYVALTNILQPFCSSMMYGEPCSTVPVYKKKKR